jgi:O2-independent ubiquinone biosynthesis accessory factor UbiT
MAETFQGELPYLMRLLALPSSALPLGFLLTRSLRDLARRKPQLFDRLGEHCAVLFFIDPTDLNYAFQIVPDGANAEVKMVGKKDSEGCGVVVRGPLLSLLGLLDGTFDGDALFFGRHISITGKVDALLALRNAIEDADLKPSDFIGVGGSIGAAADSVVLNTVAFARRLAGAPGGTPDEH